MSEPLPVPRSRLSRRSLLAGAAAGAAGVTVLLPGGVGFAAPPGGRIAFPFTLGVASGDPFPGGVVLWTRLAPEPLAADGMGGVPGRPVEVDWELATDEQFRTIERTGRETAAPESAHSVHVELAGLREGREYFYRFRAEGHLSPVGRTRTTPNPTAMGPALTMCFASCSNWPAGWFTAYRALAAEEPDLVLHLGDYQYEGTGGAGVRNAVVLTGDVHVAWANELKLDYADPAAPTVGTELVCTSVTSGGDGADRSPSGDAVMADNPHVRFRNGKRSYVRTRFMGDELRADFRVVEAVTTPNAPLRTAGSFVVPDREPGLHTA